MSRELRRVPADWQHPVDADGYDIPLYDGFCKAEARWREGDRLWDEGLYLDWDDVLCAKTPDMNGTFVDYVGKRPFLGEYMQDWPRDQRTHYQMYETVTEGTPISPVCASPEELAQWLEDNEFAFAELRLTCEQWLSYIIHKIRDQAAADSSF